MTLPYFNVRGKKIMCVNDCHEVAGNTQLNHLPVCTFLIEPASLKAQTPNRDCHDIRKTLQP
jgi:hypothetical protein